MVAPASPIVSEQATYAVELRGNTIGALCGKFDAGRAALGCAEQHDSAAAGGVKHGADVLRGRVDTGVEPDPVGKPDAATIEQDETSHLSEGGQQRPTSRLLPNPFDVRHETGQHQNINLAGAVGLEREMDAAVADIACRRRARQRCTCVQQCAGLGFGRYVKLIAKTLGQGLEVALGGGAISGEHEIADQMSD